MKAAIFDLDGTLIRYSAERRFLPWAVFSLKFCPARFLPYIWRSLKDRDFFSSKLYYRGIPLRKIEEMAAHFFSPAKVRKMVFKDALQEIEKRKQEGFRLILLTGAPQFLAERFRPLGFELVVGSKVEFKDGILTGELLDYPPGRRKKQILLQLSRELGLDLSESFGYGNGYGDRFFLEAVGRPVAVNPSRRLKKHALQKGWPVVYWK